MKKIQILLLGITLITFFSTGIFTPTTLAAIGDISTVAGGGVGDGLLAPSAFLRTATDAVEDASGNVYIADSGNHRIRKVDGVTGIISTIAGTGTPGYNGDGILAVNAQLNTPLALALDSNGDLYIADEQNQRIRKIDFSSGMISTVAGTGVAGFTGDGGLATSAGISAPNGVLFDSSDNLYISDLGNTRIRRVDAGTGNISTFAGNGTSGFSGDGGPATSATFTFSSDMDIDDAGNFYFSDGGNNRVRMVDVGGTITTVAGNGSSGYAGVPGVATSATLGAPAGVALDDPAVPTVLFITSQHGNRIVALDLGTGDVALFAGTGASGNGGDGGPALSAQLATPIALSVQGINLYISFIGGNQPFTIRKIHLGSGIISRVAGGGNGDGGLATNAALHYATSSLQSNVVFDSQGNLYVSDNNLHKVRKVDAATGIISTVAGNGDFISSGNGGLATDAGVPNPHGLAFDGQDHLYIVTESNIRKVDAVTGIISQYASVGNQPRGMVVDQTGNLFVAVRNDHQIKRVDALTQTVSVKRSTFLMRLLAESAIKRLSKLSTCTPKGFAN